MLSKKFKGRRFVRIFFFLGIAAVVFIFLQIFALKMLTGKRQVNSYKNDAGSRIEKSGLVAKLGELKQGYDKLLGIHGIGAHRQKRLSKIVLNSTLGVKPALIDMYTPDKDNFFTCLESKEKIDFKKVNDDYCDCSDFSDEPGTAACVGHADTKFYCRFQISVSDLLLIPSSRVNDGICDCCDGSDEWGDILVPPENQIQDSNQKRLSVYHAPCYDRCGELRQAKEDKERRLAEGKFKKREYIQYAIEHPEDSKIYGPQGEFVKLKNLCLSYSAGDFDYDICPFQSVKQKEFPRSLRTLGRVPEWVNQGKEGVWQLRLKGGDKDLCPTRTERQVVIEFYCGSMEEVILLREPEKCHYEVLMRTPAAC